MQEPARAARFLAFATSLLLLGGAYISQYGFGLYPCEMCWWQRYPHFFALTLAALSFARAPVRPLVAVAALAILPASRLPGYKPGEIPDGIQPRGPAARREEKEA